MDDETEREIVTPRAALARRAEHPGPQLEAGAVSERVVLLWARSLLPRALRYARAVGTGAFAGEAEIHRGSWGGVPVAIVAPGIGGPATALVVEKLAAAGARAFVGVGFAGSIHPLLPSGIVLVAERAETDGGVAPAYVAPGEPLEGHRPAVESLEAALGSEICKYQCGAVWTTDAAYRETVGKAREFRKRGCAGVDMETAALYAVARRRGLYAAAVLVLADELCRIAPLDVAAPDNLVWEWRPAPPGALDGPAGAALRGAFGAATGPWL